MNLDDIDDQPPSIVWLYHTQMLSYFIILENSQKYDVCDVMEFENILGRLKKVTIANCNRLHQRILDTIFVPHL